MPVIQNPSGSVQLDSACNPLHCTPSLSRLIADREQSLRTALRPAKNVCVLSHTHSLSLNQERSRCWIEHERCSCFPTCSLKSSVTSAKGLRLTPENMPCCTFGASPFTVVEPHRPAIAPVEGSTFSLSIMLTLITPPASIVYVVRQILTIGAGDWVYMETEAACF